MHKNAFKFWEDDIFGLMKPIKTLQSTLRKILWYIKSVDSQGLGVYILWPIHGDTRLCVKEISSRATIVSKIYITIDPFICQCGVPWKSATYIQMCTGLFYGTETFSRLINYLNGIMWVIEREIPCYLSHSFRHVRQIENSCGLFC